MARIWSVVACWFKIAGRRLRIEDQPNHDRLDRPQQPEPRQECWRELGAERQSVRFADKQRSMSAHAAIDLQEVARPEIPNSGRIKQNHLRTDVLNLFCRQQHASGRIVNGVIDAL
jgi:hypothetical protein